MKIKDTTTIAIIKGYEFNPNSEVYDDRNILVAKGNDEKIYICFCYDDPTARQIVRKANVKQIQRLKEMKII